jgi:hypothetical protein
MTTRIYEITTKDGTHLVEAGSKGAAWRHVAEKYIALAAVADGKRIAELVAAGMKVEQAKAN